MKKSIFLVLVMLAVAVGGFAQTRKKHSKTKRKPVPVKHSKTSMNGEMTLKINEQTTDETSGITVKFVELVEDSRCPEGVNCIWAGNAKVKISVSKNGANGQTIELNTNLQPRSVVYEGLTITLSDVTPHPKNNIKINRSEIAATLNITK